MQCRFLGSLLPSHRSGVKAKCQAIVMLLSPADLAKKLLIVAPCYKAFHVVVRPPCAKKNTSHMGDIDGNIKEMDEVIFLNGDRMILKTPEVLFV